MPIFSPCHCNALRQASRAATVFYDSRLRPLGIRITQYAILNAVSQGTSVSTGELARLVNLDQSSLSRALAAMTNSQWIAVKPGPDRRERHWTLTSSGRAMRARAGVIWRSSQKEFEAQLGATHIAQLHRLAGAVVDTIEGTSEGTSDEAVDAPGAVLS